MFTLSSRAPLPKRRRRQRLGAQLDGLRQQRSQAGHKPQYLADLWRLLAQILGLAQQARVATLNRTGHLIVRWGTVASRRAN